MKKVVFLILQILTVVLIYSQDEAEKISSSQFDAFYLAGLAIIISVLLLVIIILIISLKRERDIKQHLEQICIDLETRFSVETARMKTLSRKDSETGFGNRQSMYEHLNREISRSQRQGLPLSVLMLSEAIQTDNRYNPEYICSLIKCTFRKVDIVIRSKPSLFCVLMPETSAGNARVVCDRFLLKYNENDSKTVLKIGIADTSIRYSITPDEILRYTEHALEDAEASETKSIVVYE